MSDRRPPGPMPHNRKRARSRAPANKRARSPSSSQPPADHGWRTKRPQSMRPHRISSPGDLRPPAGSSARAPKLHPSPLAAGTHTQFRQEEKIRRPALLHRQPAARALSRSAAWDLRPARCRRPEVWRIAVLDSTRGLCSWQWWSGGPAGQMQKASVCPQPLERSVPPRETSSGGARSCGFVARDLKDVVRDTILSAAGRQDKTVEVCSMGRDHPGRSSIPHSCGRDVIAAICTLTSTLVITMDKIVFRMMPIEQCLRQHAVP